MGESENGGKKKQASRNGDVYAVNVGASAHGQGVLEELVNEKKYIYMHVYY